MQFQRVVGATLVTLAIGAACYGSQVGTMYACYACSNTGNTVIDSYLATGSGGPAVASDGLLFEFVNTSANPITGGVFSVSNASPNDSFSLPTIAPNGTFILVPGITSDGNSHPSGGLFALTGVMDTSDGAGGLSDSSIWSFTAMDNGLAVTSGNFTSGQPNLILPFRDDPSAGSISFIGDGPSGDAGCSNCYYGPIATLSTPNPVSGTPEPAAPGLLLAGLGVLAWFGRRASRLTPSR